jgi:hypothetical protein
MNKIVHVPVVFGELGVYEIFIDMPVDECTAGVHLRDWLSSWVNQRRNEVELPRNVVGILSHRRGIHLMVRFSLFKKLYRK